MLTRKFSLILIFSIILTLGLSISLGSLLAAWTPPSSAPPDGNIPIPINEGSSLQAKRGALILNTDDNPNGLVVQFGNVGIGMTPGAGYKLDVSGNINASSICIGGDCKSSWPVSSGGTVTSITAGSGLSGGTITTSGTISLNMANANTWTALQTYSAGQTISGGNLTFSQTGNPYFYVDSNRGVQIRLDADNNTADEFAINNGLNTKVFSVDESGILQVGSVPWARISGYPGESDPQVGTLDISKWCMSNGSGTQVNCTYDAPGGGGGVSSVSNSDTTLTISPTTGAVVASLNLAKANTWTAAQTFSGLNTSGASNLNIATNVIKAQGTATEVAVNYNNGTIKGFTVYDSTNPLLRVDSAGDVSVAQDLSFSGELRPDGLICGNGQILQKTGADNWDCVAMPVGGGGTVTSITAGSGLSGGTITTSGTISLNMANANTWTADQTFTGNLIINSQQLNHNTDNPFYINSNDALQLRINANGGSGEFGVNNSANTRVFTVKDNGDTVIGGTGKITVTTVDPVFNINGEKYATYMADYAGGTRIETSGVVQLNSENKYTIDFDNLEKGSDLWLFWQASNKDLETIAVLLTSSFKGTAWYKKDGHRLIIYGSEKGEISYRLSAPRVDFKKWGNLTEDQTLEGINVSDY